MSVYTPGFAEIAKIESDGIVSMWALDGLTRNAVQQRPQHVCQRFSLIELGVTQQDPEAVGRMPLLMGYFFHVFKRALAFEHSLA
jgi:hypothetical protein